MDAIRAVASGLGKSPSPKEYQAERQRIYEQALTKREIRPIPTAAVIRDHFGSWNAALEAAGLPAIEMHLPSFTGKQRPRYTEDQIIAWLQRAWEKVGEPQGVYKLAKRNARHRRGRDSRPGLRRENLRRMESGLQARPAVAAWRVRRQKQ